jgi:hypothetical protein
MAIIRGAYGGGQIKGSISGSTYQGSPYGTVIRNRTVPVNPNTPGQVAVRDSLATASYLWTNTLTPEQRQAWLEYAAATPIPDKFGTSQVTGARQMFMRQAVVKLTAGVGVVSDAPTTPGIAANVVPVIAASEADGITLEDLQIAGVTYALQTGEAFQISLSVPLHESNNFYKGPFVTGLVVLPADTLPVTLKDVGASLVQGQRYFARFRFFDAAGKTSNKAITPPFLVGA